MSRELRRNRLAHDRDYDADLAHARARERARRPRRTRLSIDPELRAAVQAKLELEWSPEQIARWLRATFPLRQYLPKRTDPPVHDPASLVLIEDRLNSRPRKRLD